MLPEEKSHAAARGLTILSLLLARDELDGEQFARAMLAGDLGSVLKEAADRACHNDDMRCAILDAIDMLETASGRDV